MTNIVEIKSLTRILLVCTILFYVLPLLKAQNNPDAGIWNTFSMEHEFSSKFSGMIEEELRLKENFSRLNLFYTNVGILFKPYKFIKTGLIYRNIQKLRNDNSLSSRNRLMLDITLKQKKGNLIFSYRHRLQSEVRNIYTSENGKLPEYYSRNKFEIKYDRGKAIAPYTSVELRYQLRDPRSPESDGIWHRARYVLGIDYIINKDNTLGLYYLIQNEWNIIEPEDLYIVGLEYGIVI